MRNLLISVMGPVLWIMAVTEIFSVYGMFSLYRKDKEKSIPLVVGIICIGLFYDALILALGVFLKPGSAFQILSQFRYILHLTLIPLLFPVIAMSLGLKGKLLKAVWAVTAAVIVLGLVAGCLVATESRTVGAVTRYAQADGTPGWVDGIMQFLDIFPVFLMIGAGIFILIRRRNPHMLLAGAFMLLFTMLGIFLGKDPGGDKTKSLMFFISMFGEAFMVFFLYRFSKREIAE